MKPLTSVASASAAVLLCATVSVAQPPKMKMTTPIPEGIATPEQPEPHLGTLTLIASRVRFGDFVDGGTRCPPRLKTGRANEQDSNRYSIP